MDDQTWRFKEIHKDKEWISYKRYGDVFQAEVLADRGFTYAVKPQIKPAPQKSTKDSLPSLHYRAMTLLDKVKDIFNHFGMDNLYNLEEVFG